MQPQYNPEALEDKKEVYRDTAQGAAIVKQDVPGGGTIVETRPLKEEKDEESYPAEYQQQQTTGTYTAPPTVVVRHDVRPSPRSGGPDAKKQEGGGLFWNNAFTTKTTGRFFFSLHALIVLFSAMVFISAALIEDNRPISGAATSPVGNRFAQYEMVVAQTSLGVSLGALVMERLGLLEHRPVRVALSAFQVFFWVPGLVIMTFFGSFQSPTLSANGFFGAWGALTASTVVFMHESERSRRDPRASSAPRASCLLLFFFSLMVMGSGIQLYSFYNDSGTGFNNPNDPFSYVVFSISFGAITAFLSILMLIFLDTTATRTLMFLGLLLWLWVAVGVLVLTFGDPFESALGNGYYGSLFTLLASFGLFIALRRADADRTDAQQNPNQTIEAKREARSSLSFFSHVRVMTFAGLVVMISAALTCVDRDGCENSRMIYEVAAGAVPLFFGLIVVLLELFGIYRIASGIKIGFAAVMLGWWIAAFTVLTYFGTFQTPVTVPGGTASESAFANGYFFTWIGLIFSCLAFAEALKETAHLGESPNPAVAKSGFLLLVILGSIITLGMGIDYYYSTANNTMPNLTRYAIALGAVSIFLCLVIYIVMAATQNMSYEAHDSLYNIFLYVLTLWWAVGAFVLTFMNFWSSATNNGYFAVFFTLAACLLALSGIWREGEEEEDTVNSNEPRV